MQERPSQRIAADLRESIATGYYSPGQQLPSVTALMDRYHVARATVQSVITQLRTEGLLIGRSGAGLFVRDRTALYRVAGQRLFSRQQREVTNGAHVAESGQPRPLTTHVHVNLADEDTAAALELPTAAEVLVRDEVIGLNKQPTQISQSCYPRTLTKGTPIEDDDPGPGGVLARLEDAGHTIGEHTERVTIHRATESEANALLIPEGSPCHRIQRVTRSDTGRVLEFSTMTLVDRYILLYEIPAG